MDAAVDDDEGGLAIVAVGSDGSGGSDNDRAEPEPVSMPPPRLRTRLHHHYMMARCREGKANKRADRIVDSTLDHVEIIGKNSSRRGKATLIVCRKVARSEANVRRLRLKR